MKLSLLAQILNEDFHGEDVEFSAFSTDTRTIKQGDIFVALVGENFDGHDFVELAFKRGAVAALINKSYSKNFNNSFKNLIFVADTLKAYGQAASYHASQSKAKKVAITGSCGKTSVKEMLAATLSVKGKVLATESNFNNEVGVPRTLLNIKADHDFSVVEMGASKKGDIAYLSSLVSADVVSVLNADRAHLQGLGSVDEVAREKGAIFSGAKKGGTAVLSLDEKYFKDWEGLAKENDLSVITTSLKNKDANIFLEESQPNGKGYMLIVNVNGTVCEMSLSLLGEHNIKNALISIGIAHALGMKGNEISSGLKNAKSAKGRLNVITFRENDDSINKKALVIDDSYNANPLSVKAAIDVLSTYPQPRILILGDMAELGIEQEKLHEEIGVYAKEKQVDALLTCGVLSQASFNKFAGQGKAYVNQQELLAELSHWFKQFPRGVFLVKGSRSAAMENVVKALTKIGEAA